MQAVLNETGDASLSMGAKRLADQNRAYVVDIGEHWWQDVDDLAMRTEAERRLSKSLPKSGPR